MPDILRRFTGRMDQDVHPYRVKNGDYIDALNITKDAQGVGQDIVVSNIVGNLLVNYNFTGNAASIYNKVIGRKEDKVRNRIYVFVWNPNGYHTIYYYDNNTNLCVKLIESKTDSAGIDILKFNPSKKINHVNIIYRDEGDLLFFTDGNSTPKKLNVTRILAGTYGPLAQAYIELAKIPPLAPPTCSYLNDPAKVTNALRRQLFQFAYRWVYDDFEKSTFSPWSKVPLPQGLFGTDNDLDSTKNNNIAVTFQTGDKNVIAIELAVRLNSGDNWQNFIMPASLNKAQLNILDNTTYQYLFYNDGLFPPFDPLESILLFDWVPPLADAMELANGNTPVYGSITEGYPQFPINLLQVTMTVSNVTNTPSSSVPPSLTYNQSGNQFTFTVSGSVPVGTFYNVVAMINGIPQTTITLAQYTAVLGDTTSSVAVGLYAYVTSHWFIYAVSQIGSTFTVNLPFGSQIQFVQVVNPGAGGGTISTLSTWNWWSKYRFGLVYFDKYGVVIGGVVTFSTPINSNNDFDISTPAFSESGGIPQTPVITASINHIPPAGAVKYQWVRTPNLTFGSFLYYMTCDFQQDANYYYFCLGNIDQYKADNTQFIYGSAPINPNSRIKIIDAVSGSSFVGNNWTQDYPILGVVTAQFTGGTSSDLFPYIKVTKPLGGISPAYSANMLVMIYTPAVSPVTAEDSVFFEFGEAYDIYTSGGINYHRGMTQDQTVSQPATFTFNTGDTYYRPRTMYQTLLGASPPSSQTPFVMDQSYSDFFQAGVNDNGRSQAVDVNAKTTYNPTLVRFAGSFDQDTVINQTNRFFFESQDTYDRSFGAIRKMNVRGRLLRIYQEFKIGDVPVLVQIITDVSGDPLEANSNQLLNKIQYRYAPNSGIGDCPESFAHDNFADYFVDSNRGQVCRLSNDGIIAVSELYGMNAFFVSKLAAYKKTLNNGIAPTGQPYTGDPTVYGAFDPFTGKYVVALEEINRYSNPTTLSFHQDAYTLGFHETRDGTEGFESFFSYAPEMMGQLDNLFVTFKAGKTWKHIIGSVFCNFYGTQYGAFITAVFNDNPVVKKTWISISELASSTWNCPLIQTDLDSYGTTQQSSQLIDNDFAKLENQFHAAFLRDINSIGGIIDGDFLKGGYVIIRFNINSAAALYFLDEVALKYINSPLTTH